MSAGKAAVGATLEIVKTSWATLLVPDFFAGGEYQRIADKWLR